MNRNFNKTVKYSLIKILLIPISLWIIASLVFLLLRIAPGDPVDAILGSGATLEAREILRNNLGLNESIPIQYLTFLKNLSHFNLGISLSNQEPVMEIIGGIAISLVILLAGWQIVSGQSTIGEFSGFKYLQP